MKQDKIYCELTKLERLQEIYSGSSMISKFLNWLEKLSTKKVKREDKKNE